MILARQVFHVKFGQAHAAVALLKELTEKFMPQVRGMILTDISGRDFTVVLEGEFESLAAWEQLRQAGYATPEFADWFPRFSEVVETGYTELYTIEYRQA